MERKTLPCESSQMLQDAAEMQQKFGHQVSKCLANLFGCFLTLYQKQKAKQKLQS